MEKRIIELYRRKFDDIRHEEDGIEYWYARELMTLLDYVQWRNFENVVKKGMLSCKNNGIRVEDHFAGVSKMVTLGSGANREVEDYMLTRYACYLIAENGDPRKEQIAFAMTFSITHRCANFTKAGFYSMLRYLLRKSLPVICPVTI